MKNFWCRYWSNAGLRGEHKSAPRKLSVLTLLIVVGLAVPPFAMAGKKKPNTTADLVLGEPNFSSNNSNPTDSSNFSQPYGVAIDTSVTPNRLYVADSNNNRVLGYRDVSALTNGAPADLVIGQPDFVSGACNNGGAQSAGSLCYPEGVAVDASGNLYVADYTRVLEFNAPFASCGSFPCVGGEANTVFGTCGSFTGSNCPKNETNADTLSVTHGLTLDSSGNLYIVDTENNRVLEYNTPLATNPPNTTADLVFGQGGNFNSGVCNTTNAPPLDGINDDPPTADSLCLPTGVAVDLSGNLYVADTLNYRVLEYNAPLANHTTADMVLGQHGSFTSAEGCPPPLPGAPKVRETAANFCSPAGVAVDPSGRLYVTDIGYNRVLEFNAPLTNKETTANLVFGTCGSFTSSKCKKESAKSLDTPGGVAIDASGHLYIADTDQNRVLEYHSPFGGSSITTLMSAGDAEPR